LGRFLIDGLGQRDIPQVIGGSLVVSLLAIGGELLFAAAPAAWFIAVLPRLISVTLT
jgi:ABC-type proline/glycine betaine transport system permease subunit